MDPLSALLEAGHIALDVEAPDFDACLGDLAGRLASEIALNGEQCRLLTEALRDRERITATCVGRGVAVPHAYVDGVPHVMLLFARLSAGLPHDAPDGQPVDLVFLLAGPREAQAGHLPLLARLVRLLHDQRLLEDLRRATRPADVIQAVRAVERRHA